MADLEGFKETEIPTPGIILSGGDNGLFKAIGDGGSYRGESWLGMRHGKGVYHWANGQHYEGYFVYDQIHGPGCMRRPDGRLHVGYFYAGQEEGYGKQIHSNGNEFEGLFHKGHYFGPGVAHYINGPPDVGLWFGLHLIQIPYSLASLFTTPYFLEVLKLFPIISPKSWHPGKHLFRDKASAPPVTAIDQHRAVKRLQMNAAAVGQENPDFDVILEEEFDKILMKTLDKSRLKKSEVLRNSSERLVEIQKLTRKMQTLASRMTFQPDDLLTEREMIQTGSKTREVVEFFQLSIEADLRNLQKMVFEMDLNVDVCDVSGFTPLMAAALRNREAVMNLLLDFGANINHVTSDGLSAVQMCAGMYHCFVEKFNMWQESDPSAETIFIGKPVVPTVASPTGKSARDLLTGVKSGGPSGGLSPVGTPGLKGLGLTPSGTAKPPKPPEEFRLDLAEQKGSFQSAQSLKKVTIPVAYSGFLRAGDQLFGIPHIFRDEEMTTKPEHETPLFLAWLKTWQSAMKSSLLILLRRGADWKNCNWPQPFLFTAVRGVDGDLVRCLVGLGAPVNERMTREGMSVAPLLVACGMPGINAVEVVEALLAAGADPNAPEVNTLPENPKATQMENKREKKDQTDPSEKGRRPIHVVCQRDVGDQATELLLELLVWYKARADFIWNNTSPLTAAVRMGNIKMVRALLDAGSDVNQDLGAGYGNALCVLASLAVPDKFLNTNKDAETIKAVMRLLLESADFTIKIGLPEGPPGSPLDYAVHLYTKQPLPPALAPEFKSVLEDLRKTILEAYKTATQTSVLRRRKLMLAGSITPQVEAMLRKYPWLIDVPDPGLARRLSPPEKELVSAIANIRDRIEELMVADIIENGQKLRPTLKVPYHHDPTSPHPLAPIVPVLHPDEDHQSMPFYHKDAEPHHEDPHEELAESGKSGSSGEDSDGSRGRAKGSIARALKKEKMGRQKPDRHGKEKDGGKGKAKEKTDDRKIKKKKFTHMHDGAGDILRDVHHEHHEKEHHEKAAQSEDSIDTQDFETEADAKFRKQNEKLAKKAHAKMEAAKKRPPKKPKPPKPPPKTQPDKSEADPDQPESNKKAKAPAKKKKKKKKDKKHRQKKIRVGRDEFGLIMEHHPVHHKNGVQHDPEYEPSHGKLPLHDPFDPDNVTLIVPAVHMLDKEGDFVPLDHKKVEYKYCSNCARSTGAGLFACPRCNSVFYDSKECQNAHWPAHKMKCLEICRRKEHNEQHKKLIIDSKTQRKIDSRNAYGPPGAAGAGALGERFTPGGRGGLSKSPFGDRPDSRNYGKAGKQKGGKAKRVVNISPAENRGKRDGGHDRERKPRHEKEPRIRITPTSSLRKPRKPGVAAGGANVKHLRAIKHAAEKPEAEWMDMVRGVQVLRMDDDMQQFLNSHYQRLLNRGLNLADPHDLVELKNAEFYAAIAFHRHVTVEDLLHYTTSSAEIVEPVERVNEGGGPAAEKQVVPEKKAVTTKAASTFFVFEKVNDGNFSFT